MYDFEVDFLFKENKKPPINGGFFVYIVCF